MITPTLTSREVSNANRFLQSIAFLPKGPNPEWWECIVISMVARDGTQRQIEENAYLAGKVLGLRLKDRREKDSHPNFHFGDSEVRDYHFKKDKHRREIGKATTFDELEPYCATHARSYEEAGDRTDPCGFSCRYGLKHQGRLTSEVIASFGA